MFEGLKRALDGGRSELSRDNLVRLVVDRVVALREYGKRGETALPPEVEVVVTVPTERVAVVRGFVDEPAFDREVEDELANRVVGVSRDLLPLRRYTVDSGDTTQVVAIGRADASVVRLTLFGGDRDGAAVAIPAGQRFVRLGRGAWHGPDQRERNDLVVSGGDAFVSRRAARLRRVGGGLEVESLDQGECLVVCRLDGARIRPHHTPGRWVVVRSGDSIELNDGDGGRTIRVGVQVGGEIPR
ncbi:MAG: hypothetical protein ABMB14_28015 [Myxococcota bacterium]